VRDQNGQSRDMRQIVDMRQIWRPFWVEKKIGFSRLNPGVESCGARRASASHGLMRFVVGIVPLDRAKRTI